MNSTAPVSRPAAAGSGSPAIAVVGVSVIPMDSPVLRPDRTVVIRDGRIAEEADRTAIDTIGMDIVDGRGRYLMPALADMHVHLWDTGECGLFLANGITTVRNMWGTPYHLAYEKAHASGQISGPRVITVSPLVDGLGDAGTTIWPGSRVLDDPEDARALVAEFADRGYSMIKAYSWLKPQAVAALGAECTRQGLRLVGHCPDAVSFEEAVDAGMICFEHLTNIARGHLKPGYQSRIDALRGVSNPERVRLTVAGIDYRAIRRLAERMADEQVWNCPTLVVMQRMIQDQTVARADPDLRYVPDSMLEAWDPSNDFRLKTLDWAEAMAANEARTRMHMEITAILHDAGAPMMLGTDTPNPYVVPGFSIHHELANFVAAGIDPYAALRYGTVEAARFMGEDDWGSVRIGNRAELLLLNANPLTDVGALRQLVEVYTAGRRLTRHDLDRLLADREALVAPEREWIVEPLPTIREEASVVQAGILEDRMAERRVGQVAFKCSERADGSRRVEEHHRDATSDTATRIEISPMGRVVSADLVTERSVGQDKTHLSWNAGANRYDLQRTALDGITSRTSIESVPIVPADQWSLTAMHFLESNELESDTGLKTIVITDDEASVADVTVTDDGNSRAVAVELKGDRKLRLYYRQESQLAAVTEPTWHGQRTVTALNADLPNGPPLVAHDRQPR